MFPAVSTRTSHVRRILVIALAALMAFAILAIVPGGTPAARAGQSVDYTITFANDAETGPGPIVSGTGDQDGLTVVVEGETIDNIHASCSDLFNLYEKVGEDYIRLDPLPANWGYGESGNPQSPQRRIWDFSFVIHLPNGDKACGNTPPPPPDPIPAIDIEKATNGDDADEATGPDILVGDPVTWTYVVTNTGEVDLTDVKVTDDLEGDICDIGDLAVDEVKTCEATGTAAPGQYENEGKVTGFYPELEAEVMDTDPSHYIGIAPPPPAVPSIDIEKATNGEDADTPTGPTVTVGDPVTWTYVVTNTGDVDLTNVKVTDDELGDICTIGDLAVGESDTCTAHGVATLGQYDNIGTVTGNTLTRSTVSDTDPSHYLGVAAPVPGIHIEKATNGDDADTAENAPIVDEGSTVTWTYVVTNTGDVPLSNVVVTDDQGVVPVYQSGDTNGDDLLDVTETWIYEATGIAVLDLYANIGTVVGYHGEDKVTDEDPSHYAGIAVLGTAQLGDTVWYDANKNGVQDNGEDGINGAVVTLKDADGTVVATATTATGAWNGFYKFLELDAGTYTATLDMSSVKSTYVLTTAAAITVTIEDGDDYLDADFGLVEPEEELPKTGLDSEELAMAAFGLLALGSMAVLSTRKQGIKEI